MSRVLSDLIGQSFGDLTVVSRIKKKGEKEAIWLCKCKCGGEAYVTTSHWKRGQKYCPICFPSKRGKHRMCHTPTHSSWSNMIQRCTNPNAIRYEYYGGNGVSVCDRWLDPQNGFSNFLVDMG